MPVQAALTLNTKVYVPRGKTSDVASWALVGDATFGGATSIVQESVRGPSKDGIYRVRFTLDVPKAATADSACGCIGSILSEGYADIQIRVPATFTTAERQDLVDRIQSLVATSVFDVSVGGLEGSW
jgi:hypothetical protein